MAAFLDNTSDIILDAVLTDYGRQLLAKGDGTFNIVKFAFGDDEIDYGLWNATASAELKDQAILETPVMEAFTNNAASMKSKLLTLSIDNLLYLPVLKLDTTEAAISTNFNDLYAGIVLPLDKTDAKETSEALAINYEDGLLNYGNRKLIIDQGLDSPDLDPTKSLADNQIELYEKEYNISIDNRLGEITADLGTRSLTPSSVDDDNMAIYKVSETLNTNFVKPITTTDTSVIAGWKGSRLSFTIRPKASLVAGSDALFTRLGNTQQLDGSENYKTIRSSVRVTGVTTGFSIEIPILFAKLV